MKRILSVFLSVLLMIAPALAAEEPAAAPRVQDMIRQLILYYSVYGSEAVYYHATKVCRTQTNGRELTVRDALREGLEPCPNCNPPTIDS